MIEIYELSGDNYVKIAVIENGEITEGNRRNVRSIVSDIDLSDEDEVIERLNGPMIVAQYVEN